MREEAFSQRLLAETRHEIDRADSKASILVGAAFVSATLMVGALISRDLEPRSSRGVTQLLLALTALALATTIVKFGQAIYPRTEDSSSGGADYFADHAVSGSAEELAATIREVDPFERDTRQLRVLGRIAVRKYECLKWGMRAGAAALALSAAAAATEQLL